uniref:Uncharacterized protein n=1 Tax=Lepeophtheirus salmonis TaxID=72036 RepID=A0A0K2UUD7_LEPSM
MPLSLNLSSKSVGLLYTTNHVVESGGNRFFTIFGYTLGSGRNIFYAASCTWHTRRRNIQASCCPHQVFRLFCEFWILKVDYVDYKLGEFCKKLLSQNADFHSTIEYLYTFLWRISFHEEL